MIRDWSRIASTTLVDRLGVASERADELGIEIALEISQEYAGQSLYMPLCMAFKASQRDREIYAEYNRAAGRNVESLIKKYELSYVSILRICRRVRAIEKAEREARQTDMFTAPGAMPPEEAP
ncbi:MAG: DNA-binding protein [Xanthomonadales bacterium]|nr:DNA-binding protein [Xanthomonadales bacterium]